MKVPLLDLQAQYEQIKEEIQSRVQAVFDSQQFILGPEVERCEAAVASYVGAAYGVGVSSGSDALLISLLTENIGPGDEVITTPYSFFATAGSIVRAGAKPVFVDIKPDTYNLDPQQIEQMITPRTKAIIPVHLFGQLADMERIMDIADRNSLCVIEDAAQAIGSEHAENRAGNIGHYGCFSFFPSKNLSGAGDGGMVTTNDPERAEKLRSLRVHGMTERYHHPYVGANMRFDALQAAVVSVKLKYLDEWTEARQRNADYYNRRFAEEGLAEEPAEGTSGAPDAPGGGRITTPNVKTDRHVFNQYVIRAEQRDALFHHLKENAIGTAIYYPKCLHQQECLQYLEYGSGDFPQSENAAAETLALPVYPELTAEQAEAVVDTVKNFYTAH